MNNVTRLLCLFVFLPALTCADPVLDEETVKAISQELAQAIKSGDMAVFEKYMHPDSKIVVDMDPANGAGEMEIGYEEFMALTGIAMQAMGSAEIHDELISINVNEARNEATIKEKTTATIEMLGIKMRDVSINETTYGIIDGQIKVLSTQDQLISSGPIE